MKKIVVLVLNGVLLALSLIGILCYFFGPVWSIGLTYHFTSEELSDMVGPIENIDLEEALGEDGLDIDLALDIDMNTFAGALGEDAEGTVNKIIDKNVDGIAVKLTASLDKVMQKVVTSLAKNIVRDKVNEQVRDYLSKNLGKDLSDGEMKEKLERAGLGEEFIGAKTEELFNAIYSEELADVEEIGDLVVGIVDEAYANLQKVDNDFENAKPLNESQRTSVKNGVKKVLDKFAAEDGTLNPDEILNGFMTEMLQSMNGKNSASTHAEFALMATEPQAEDGDALKSEIKTLLYNKLPKEIAPILSWVLRASFALVLISAAAWIYTIVKIVIKFVKRSENPTVKLKLPILFGWLPFLILFAVPSLALWIVGMTPLAASGGALEMLSRLTVSFQSIGWIALLCAGIALGISIYYMIYRKKAPASQAAYYAGGYEPQPVREAFDGENAPISSESAEEQNAQDEQGD